MVTLLLASILLTDAGENQDRLSCFDCRSGNSWEECGSREGEQRCQNGQNRCGLLSLGSSVQKIYMKGCFKDSDCINYQHPNWCSKNAAADPHCFSNIICCEHDFCNQAKIEGNQMSSRQKKLLLAVILHFDVNCIWH